MFELRDSLDLRVREVKEHNVLLLVTVVLKELTSPVKRTAFSGRIDALARALVNTAFEVVQHVIAGAHGEGDDWHRGGLVRAV